MKRFIHIVLFYFFTLGIACAQADVTLNIRLFPIQVIEVNPLPISISLDYKTTADAAMVNPRTYLNMYSTGGFVMKVKSLNASTRNVEVINKFYGVNYQKKETTDYSKNDIANLDAKTDFIFSVEPL